MVFVLTYIVYKDTNLFEYSTVIVVLIVLFQHPAYYVVVVKKE